MSSLKKSSFQKRGPSRTTAIKGTKPSLHNSQLLISSGIPSFDALLGGGVPVGSLVIINEDEYGTYAKFILKYFLAEGIVSNHSCFVTSQNEDPEKLVMSLPCPVDVEIEDEGETEIEDKKMTIAWRYENLKPVSSTLSNYSHFGHYFDLSKPITEKVLKNADIEYWSGASESSGESFQTSYYYYLLKSIESKLNKGKFLAKQVASDRNILRIVLHQLDSPLWHHDGNAQTNDTYLYTFLYSLRALLRNAYSTCFITLPFTRYRKDHNDKCIHLGDIAVQLQSFAGTKFENMSAHKDYHGFFFIQKMAAINCLVSFNPGVTNLAFKLKRKKLVIEEFHLPPELEDSAEREQDDSAVMTCSSGKSSKLDF